MGSVESNISAIRTLLDSGVNIISIVAGNECFFSYRFNWEKYKNDFEPILRACEKEFPDIPRLICLGQDFDKKIIWDGIQVQSNILIPPVILYRVLMCIII